MKDKKRLSAYQRFANSVELPVDVSGALSYIKMYSNREILIEDAGKLIQYSEDCVKVRQKKQVICVCGNSLRIMCLANNDLRVTGYIMSVSFE